MAKRGFFAEMNHQAQQAEKRRRQQEAAAARAHASAVRAAEIARRKAENARAATARASAAEQKAAERVAAQLYAEARAAEANSMNVELANAYEEIDGLLAATLEVDDYVDLESLKVTSVEHPPFRPGRLAVPAEPMPELVYPPQPEFVGPPAPTGLSGVFGKKKHQEAVAQAEVDHRQQCGAWQAHCQKMHDDYVAEQAGREQAEAQRVKDLVEAEHTYKSECAEREAEAEQRNADLTKLINDLAFDVPDAIEQYVGVVLSNSVYPENFPVSHDYAFDLDSRELALTVRIPEPADVPAVKEYRYAKGKDEITPSMLPVKAQKDRYADAVWQVAVRTLHEVFEADRAGKIHTIALTVGVDRIAPATGLPETVPLAVVSADMESFGEFDLARVVPHATLTHLGAAVSKAPFDLAPADTGSGVRVRGLG
ncbi:hypothetical protein [Terrabacter carboxydivorans]|uniref:Restriction system protein n=1 Tax=Terrabacter carboxydivorans TaxID=619730 RepID=A0ABP5Z9N8_9MICO